MRAAPLRCADERKLMNAYKTFLERKETVDPDEGKAAKGIHDSLFPFQKAIVKWACKKGRAAVWADTGLGKTRVQLEWARQMGKRTLILAPLAVAQQTVREAEQIGLTIQYAKEPKDSETKITITNYERLERFDDEEYGAVVLDESSILKSLTGKTRQRLIERFEHTPYKLCCTATPAPNDFMELGNHAQFLGIMSWAEMAATFFVRDQKHAAGTHQSSAWRLKGHAEDGFWEWLSSWGLFCRKPSDLGFSDDGFDLPKLSISDVQVPSDYRPEGMLFAQRNGGIHEHSRIRKGTIDQRVEIARETIAKEPRQRWIVWCGLNEESEKMTRAIPGAVEVKGSDSLAHKESALLDFASGKIKVLISKPKIAGFGMNFQVCARQLFLGLGYSFEQYYQCIRRSWRFGQKRPVNVTIVVSDLEVGVLASVRRKERDALDMGEKMAAKTRKHGLDQIRDAKKAKEIYHRDKAEGDGWELWQGDCVEVMGEMPNHSVDFSIYSPPFSSLFTYTASTRDMGNSKTDGQFHEHFKHFAAALLRITKPGRITACHVSQIPAMDCRDGYIGLKDFRGDCIRSFMGAGWIHHGEVVIDKNPQAQAIRTKAKGLLFAQLRKDSSWLRPALADFILVFRAPGDNVVPIKPDITNDDWIKWAHPVWTDIRETKTLSAREGRDKKDERHICPLQLDVIERCLRLWSNPGEYVLSPFAGIGSEGYQAIVFGRKFRGIELKRSYYETAIRNLKRAESKVSEGVLFSVKG